MKQKFIMVWNCNYFKKWNSDAWYTIAIQRNFLLFWFFFYTDIWNFWALSIIGKSCTSFVYYLLRYFKCSFCKKLCSFLWPDDIKEGFVLVAFGKCTLQCARSVLMLAPLPCPLFSGSQLIVIFIEKHIFCCLLLLSDDAIPISCKQEKTILPPDVLFSNLANTSSSSVLNRRSTPSSGINQREATAFPLHICWMFFSIKSPSGPEGVTVMVLILLSCLIRLIPLLQGLQGWIMEFHTFQPTNAHFFLLISPSAEFQMNLTLEFPNPITTSMDLGIQLSSPNFT